MAAPVEERGGTGAGLVSGALRAVPVRAVEGELTRLWEAGAGPGDPPSGPGALRACTLNVLIAAAAGEDPEALTPLLGEVMAWHPCRAILLQEAGAGASVQAAVRALCHLPPAGDALLCGEQILLTAGEEGRPAAAGAALSLLIPNLPVVLWWRGPLREADERFVRLAAAADRILLDSAELPGGGPELARLAELVGRYRYAALTDLAWGRLTPWRSLTAQFFDSPEARPCLHRLAEVTVTFGGSPAGARQALLYAGWLASRLGWRGEGGAPWGPDGAMRVTLPREGGEVHLLLHPGAGPAGGIAGVSLRAEGEPPARFRLERAADGVCVGTETVFGDRPPLSRLVCLEESGEAALIQQELRLLGRDRIFEEALRAAAALAPR